MRSLLEPDQEAESTRLMLDVIETRDQVTQRGLAGELGIALGLTNIYLKRCISKGLVKVRKAPARRYTYALTAKGFSEKARLTTRYLARSLSFSRLAREDCTEVLETLRRRGVARVALIGGGELCEIATLAALDCGIEVVAVYDAETDRQRLAGVNVVRDPAGIAAAEAVMITDVKDPQGAYDRMVGLLGTDKVLFPSLLRLSTCRPAASLDGH